MKYLRDVTEMTMLCEQGDLIPNAGVCALYEGEQIAVFYTPARDKTVHAIANWDPVGKANVLSRGIVGTLDDKLVVASPLYKDHFDLMTGECLENEAVFVKTYDVALVDGKVVIN